MSAEVKLGAVFGSGVPRRLFPVRMIAAGGLARQYAVSRDGKRFLVAVREQVPSVPLTVIANWLANLK